MPWYDLHASYWCVRHVAFTLVRIAWFLLLLYSALTSHQSWIYPVALPMKFTLDALLWF